MPRLDVHPSPWHPSDVHQFRLEYKLQPSPSASSQSWLTNLPPKSTHCTVVIVIVDVVGGGVAVLVELVGTADVDVSDDVVLMTVAVIVVSSKLTADVFTPLTTTVTD